jgi:predicted aspartyl protease
MSIVRTRVSLKGMRGSKDCIALVGTGAAMTVIDRSLAENVGVTYTGRMRSLVSATGHKLEGEVAIVRELVVEDEVLDYEKVMVVELSGDVRKVLREMGVDDSVIIGLTTVELAGLMPDIATGRLKKVETYLF